MWRRSSDCDATMLPTSSMSRAAFNNFAAHLLVLQDSGNNVMAGNNDEFDCRVPHPYELAIPLAVMDQLRLTANGADEFFDVAAALPEAARGRVILRARRGLWQNEKEKSKDKKKEPPTPKEKTHQMVTRQEIAMQTTTLGKFSRQCLKRSILQSPSTKGPPSKYIALAEQVYHFFTDTPPRFRTLPRKPEGKRDKELVKQTLTVPQSPHLRTKERARSASPISEGRNKEQGRKKRDKELVKQTLTVPQSPHLRTKERARSVSPLPGNSHLFKARPLNPKVFRPPDMSLPQPKPTTVAVPFNFTYVPRKVRCFKLSAESNKQIQFKARPTPTQRTLKIELSSVVRRVAVGGEENIHCGVKHSFEKRDRIAKQEKEKKIKMLLEKASAKIYKFTIPVPSFIYQRCDETSSVASSSASISSGKSIHHHQEITQEQAD
ncbi:hypothetical protein GE061_013172 [Apolygus lucorum]|uniref:TPX2 central domain-containing protein n=1 Tax=Apolygus lucorum TaxID=248454 RepID=A0A8S9XX27_APOLU|nr:hypothetical protein GE061_013172 [Apolygus lucorum]